MGQAKKRGTLAERQRAAIESSAHVAADHGKGTWRARKAAAEYFLGAMQDLADEKQLGEDVTVPYATLLKYMWETGYEGACHSTSAILYVMLSEKGLAPKLCIGEVRCGKWHFDHSWVELDGVVFDVAISLPQPGGAPAGGPVFASIDLDSGEASGVQFGISDGQGLDSDALIPRLNTLEGYAQVQRQMAGTGPDIWNRIVHLAPQAGLQCTVPDLIAKYGNVRREYRCGDGEQAECKTTESTKASAGEPDIAPNGNWLSPAMLVHHAKYLGTRQRRNPDTGQMEPYVPTPQEVVDDGLEPQEYLDQFKQ